MEVNQVNAEKFLHEGGKLICLGFPKDCEFGIDMKYFTTTDNFRGIKFIPPGIHFIYYSCQNSYGDQSPRIGFFQNFKKGEIIIKKWDSKKEEFFDEKNKQVVSNLMANIKTLDKHLGAYPFDVWSKWNNLSSQISETLTQKVTSESGKVYSAPQLIAQTQPHNNIQITQRQKGKLFLCDEVQEDILPNLVAVEGTELQFLKIPDKCYPENSTPSEITKHNLDSSYLFECLLSQCKNFRDVLGEIQLAFICFLIGCSFEAFEHWKKLVGIFCSCDEAISKNSEIFNEFISIFNFQLQEVQEDFLVDIVAGSNFVYQILRTFFRNLQTGCANERLKAKGRRFQELLTEKFHWDFSDIFEEDEDDLPVIVGI